MTTQEPEKKPELDAMMKRLGLLGIDSKEPRPGGPAGEGRAARRGEPQASPTPPAGGAQGDELKDFLKHLETLEKEGAKKVEGLSAEGDSVMARLEKLDLASLRDEVRAPAPVPARAEQAPAVQEARQAGSRPQATKNEDDFVALIRGIEEVKRDLLPETAGKPVARREIRAEKVDASGERKERQPAPSPEPEGGEPEFTSILDRLQKLDLTNVGGETKTDLDDIAAWKKGIRKEAEETTPARVEAAPPQPSQQAQGVDAESILKRLEGLTPPAEPKAVTPKPRAAPAEAVPPQPVKATQISQGVDADTILKRLEGLTPPSEPKVVSQRATAGTPREPASSPPAPQAVPGIDTESLLRNLEGLTPPDQRVSGKSKWEAAAPAREEPKAKAADAPQSGPGKNGSEKDVTSVIDTIFKVHKGSPMGVPTEDVDASLKQIIEEETREGTAGDEEREAVHAKKTRWSDGEQEGTEEAIVSVDEIKDISNLILPKGATFAIDEVKLHERTAGVFDVKGGAVVPSEIVESWQSQLPAGVIKDIVIGKEAGDETKPKGLFGKLNIMKVIRKEVEEYNPRVHGPLVDLAFRPAPNIEEVEVYPVNEPYAFIRVLHDNSTHEYTYQVLEPVLNPAQKDLVIELKQRLFETLEVNTKDLTKDAAHKAIRGAVDTVLSDYGISLTPVDREKILYNIEKEFLGDGLVDPVMHDKYIEDISCDGVNVPIFVYHTSYENTKTNLIYKEAVDLDSFVTKMAQRAGKHISIAEPILDATMPDGSRIQMTLGSEVTAHGSTFTIRKFREEPITPTDLIEWQTFSPLAVAYLWLAVESGKSAIFAGGTASGKTTSLNAISLFIPPMAKIVSLEDTRELKLPHPNWIPSITRDSFDTNGKGEIDMYELLRAALRQRPEYLIVGEIRGKEALTLFQAMSTGHVTYATMHADSVASVVHRIENPPLSVPRNMLSALNLVCVQTQARIGGQRIRRSKQVIEILDIDPRTNELITNEVFRWHPTTDEIRYSGKSYILEEIMEEKGWSEARMKEELKRRQELLEWMRLKMIRHYKDVAKMLISYFRDPEAVIEVVRADLYAEAKAP
ncbi:MAG TPA: ATPase, T2SS/T4P/T4SS family [Methanomicrobiales archaeon]|nr:ATPase, T2SS/T4P/T4SS family [Methanomicrobiales archaeon]